MPEMKVGTKYLVLKLGDTDIPFFPSETKAGKKCYKTTLTIFVNEKQENTKKEETIL